MSFVLLGILNSQASGVAEAYFLSVLGGAGSDTGRGITTNLDGNIYVTGTTDSTGSGGEDLLLAQYNKFGEVQFQRVLGGANNDRGYSVATDSAGNVYVAGDSQSVGTSARAAILAKYDASGTIQWQRRLGGAVNTLEPFVGIDSADNVYVVGTDNVSSQFDGFIAKYNSSGTIQWQRTLGNTANERFNGLAFDSADNVYVSGETNSQGGSFVNQLIVKYNSSGTIQWQRILSEDSNEEFLALAVDSSDNIYACGAVRFQNPGSGGTDMSIAKYNSSGTLLFQKIFYGAEDSDPFSIAFDSLDNFYIIGTEDGTTYNPSTFTGEDTNNLIIAKFNSSGALQWQRAISGSDTFDNENGFSIAIDPSDNIAICGFTSTTGSGFEDLLIARLPSDGSLQGTYVLDGQNIEYQASSFTLANSTLVASTGTLGERAGTLDTGTSSLTSSTSTLTAETVEIG